MGVRDRIAKAVMGIKAYHSSPHDFDRFDLSKIGTGEGAQVYGHGIYAAENPAVSGQGGQYWNQFLNRFEGTPEGNAAKRLRDAGFDREKAAADYEAFLLSKAVQPRPTPAAEASARRLYEAAMARGNTELDLLRSGAPVGPRTYELNIKADPAQMLNWDKPLREQTHIQDVLADRMLALEPSQGIRTLRRVNEEVDFLGGKSGDALYRSFSTNPREATAALREAGIPGIKYLDEGSRGVPQEVARYRQQLADPGFAPHHEQIQKLLSHWEAKPVTSNYVVFDPSIIDITKKYGIPGAIAAPVMGAIGNQSRYEEAQ